MAAEGKSADGCFQNSCTVQQAAESLTSTPFGYSFIQESETLAGMSLSMQTLTADSGEQNTADMRPRFCFSLVAPVGGQDSGRSAHSLSIPGYKGDAKGRLLRT